MVTKSPEYTKAVADVEKLSKAPPDKEMLKVSRFLTLMTSLASKHLISRLAVRPLQDRRRRRHKGDRGEGKGRGKGDRQIRIEGTTMRCLYLLQHTGSLTRCL